MGMDRTKIPNGKFCTGCEYLNPPECIIYIGETLKVSMDTDGTIKPLKLEGCHRADIDFFMPNDCKADGEG